MVYCKTSKSACFLPVLFECSHDCSLCMRLCMIIKEPLFNYLMFAHRSLPDQNHAESQSLPCNFPSILPSNEIYLVWMMRDLFTCPYSLPPTPLHFSLFSASIHLFHLPSITAIHSISLSLFSSSLHNWKRQEVASGAVLQASQSANYTSKQRRSSFFCRQTDRWM